jgi:hypothetical protein
MSFLNPRPEFIRRHLKIGIFILNQGEAEIQPASIRPYGEDLHRGINADVERKDFFEIGFYPARYHRISTAPAKSSSPPTARATVIG